MIAGRSLFAGHREESLESGRYFFPVDNRGFNFFETCGLEQAGDLDFCESQMRIGIQFTSFFERMLEEIKDHDFPIAPEDPVDLFKSSQRVRSMMECLAENGEVDRFVFYGR